MSHRSRSRFETRVPSPHTYGGQKTGTRKTGWMWPRSRTLISATTACITALRSGRAPSLRARSMSSRTSASSAGPGTFGWLPDASSARSERLASSEASSADSSSIRRVQTSSLSRPSSNAWKYRSSAPWAFLIRASTALSVQRRRLRVRLRGLAHRVSICWAGPPSRSPSASLGSTRASSSTSGSPSSARSRQRYAVYLV